MIRTHHRWLHNRHTTHIIYPFRPTMGCQCVRNTSRKHSLSRRAIHCMSVFTSILLLVTVNTLSQTSALMQPSNAEAQFIIRLVIDHGQHHFPKPRPNVALKFCKAFSCFHTVIEHKTVKLESRPQVIGTVLFRTQDPQTNRSGRNNIKLGTFSQCHWRRLGAEGRI